MKILMILNSQVVSRAIVVSLYYLSSRKMRILRYQSFIWMILIRRNRSRKSNRRVFFIGFFLNLLVFSYYNYLVMRYFSLFQQLEIYGLNFQLLKRSLLKYSRVYLKFISDCFFQNFLIWILQIFREYLAFFCYSIFYSSKEWIVLRFYKVKFV